MTDAFTCPPLRALNAAGALCGSIGSVFKRKILRGNTLEFPLGQR